MQETDKITGGTEAGAKPRSLGLSIPPQAAPPEHSLFLEPEETSAWIAALPLANIGETSRQVYTQLSEFNQCAIPTMVRVKDTELFRPIVAYISDNLHRHFMDMGFPLSQKAWKTLILSRELNNELAISYKIVIEDILSSQQERLDKKLLIIALHRALYYLSQVFLQTCLSYTPPPPGLWKEINTLFAFSRQNRLHRVQVKMKTGGTEETSTIEDRYKALMLFAGATPSRLAQAHLESAFQKTLEWAASTDFIEPENAHSDHDVLNVNLRADEPPIHNALRKPTSTRHVAVLSVSRLIGELEDEYQRAPLDGSKQVRLDANRLPRSLLGQLIRSWHSPSERQFQRTQLNFSLQVSCGLREIHSKLIEQRGTQDETPLSLSGISGAGSTPGSCTLTLMDSHEGSSPGFHNDAFAAGLTSLPGGSGSNWTRDYGVPDIPSSTRSTLSGLDLELSSDGAQTSSSTVTTVNESATGYCIRWSDSDQGPKTRLGELVGVGAEDRHSSISLGVVRWLHCTSQTELEVGLQIIPGQVKAARAYEALAEGKIPLRNRHNPITCLFLPVSPGSEKKEGPSLVLASTAYPLGTCLWLEDMEDRELHLIRLSRLLDFSGTFARFGFEYIGKDDTDGAGDDRSEFENLWKSL